MKNPREYNATRAAEGHWIDLPPGWSEVDEVLEEPGSAETVRIVMEEQREANKSIEAGWYEAAPLKVDGKLGALTLAWLVWRYPLAPKYIEFTDEVADRLIAFTAEMESHGRYWACNRDGEYEGKFDRTSKTHRASKHGDTPTHIGLSWGYIQFTQDGGSLGRVLELAAERSLGLFREIFGEASDELLEVVTCKGKSGFQRGIRRGPRVKKVAGADLWEEPWLSRFVAAGKLPLFQWAQRRAAHERYMKPTFTFAIEQHLNSERAVVILFDRACQLGVGGMRKLVRRMGIGSTSKPADPVEFCREALAVLEERTAKNRWGHRVRRLRREAGLRDWVVLV